jgi:hypothetical protein
MLSKIANFLKLKTVTVPPQKPVEETPKITTTMEIPAVDASLTGIKPVVDEPVTFQHAQVEAVTEPAPKAKRKPATKKPPARKASKSTK